MTGCFDTPALHTIGNENAKLRHWTSEIRIVLLPILKGSRHRRLADN